ncbi:MAG: ABC transporter permease [Perlabentimonas sp.]
MLKKNRNNPLLSIAKSSIFGNFVIILFISLAMSLVSSEFLTVVNFNVIARSISVMAIVGLAQMVILGMGGMNLSVGAIGGLVGVIAGSLMVLMNWPIILAVIAGLVVGALCGFINGFFITRLYDASSQLNVPAFLVTLASASIFTGINLGITKAVPIYGLPASYISFGRMTVGGISVLIFVLIPVILVAGFVIHKTLIGRQILAVGGNTRAAELSGISINKVAIICNMLSGILAAIAALIVLARLGSAQPTVGSEWLLFSFAAPLIGGTKLDGGHVNVLGTILGATLLALVANSLVHLQVSVYWTTFIHGLIIIVAVGVERFRTIRVEKWGVHKNA